MSKKSFALLSGLGLAAAATGAYAVRRRGASDAGFEDAVPAQKAADHVADGAAPVMTEWSADDDEAPSGERAAVVDEEPAKVR